MRVLVVEDDDGVRTALRLALEDEGYLVFDASSGEQAVQDLVEVDPDFMLVDLMLGGMTGFDCIREVRRTSQIPIVVVSARDDTHDVVAGLEAGADDYVTKPFQIKEITARMRALQRRARHGVEQGDLRSLLPTSTSMVLDGSDSERRLVLDVEGGRLLRADQPVHLTLTEFRLLCELAEAAGRVLSRGQLLDRVWDHGFFGDDRLVDVHVRRLRTKIETDPSDPRLLVTVRGLGYRLDPR